MKLPRNLVEVLANRQLVCAPPRTWRADLEEASCLLILDLAPLLALPHLPSTLNADNWDFLGRGAWSMKAFRVK